MQAGPRFKPATPKILIKYIKYNYIFNIVKYINDECVKKFTTWYNQIIWLQIIWYNQIDQNTHIFIFATLTNISLIEFVIDWILSFNRNQMNTETKQ